MRDPLDERESCEATLSSELGARRGESLVLLEMLDLRLRVLGEENLKQVAELAAHGFLLFLALSTRAGREAFAIHFRNLLETLWKHGRFLRQGNSSLFLHTMFMIW